MVQTFLKISITPVHCPEAPTKLRSAHQMPWLIEEELHAAIDELQPVHRHRPSTRGEFHIAGLLWDENRCF